ncbi:hypothetical protein RND71_043543 [Anisodus tanguticus]|uniref:Peroxisomal multifunctional enzyme type 2 n=1 Tax=Anisodus tanguticus TaxID=243964 RepID=A0AAE1UMD0_9SOLA|nr:hypothetical protein RND71_043543 [Anisodus tanguticus]
MSASRLLNFSGKVAVVTGAGNGLGREYALMLASRGASVVDLVHKVHLKGAFSVTKAAWPHFRAQSFGSSNAGLFGNFGQANYSSAKLGLLGLSNTLAVEGSKYNIFSNTIVPVAASRLTQDILPPNIYDQLQPKYVAPLVTWLCHEDNQENGSCFEVAGGFIGKYRLQRIFGKTYSPPSSMTPESIRDDWHEINSSKKFTLPETIHDLSGEENTDTDTTESENLSNKENKSLTVFEYKAYDAILYALSVGVSTKQKDHLNFLYENSEEFRVLPTFGIAPSIDALLDLDVMSEARKKYPIDFDPTKLLHGEQYLEVFQEIPPNCKTTSEASLIEVLDKGSGALVIADCTTYDNQGESKSGKPNCVIEMSDENMTKLALNELDPVKAFMSGHIRLKGNPMLTQKLDILFKLDSADAYELFVDNTPQEEIISEGTINCKTDYLFSKWLVTRLSTIKELIPMINNVYQWNILKDGKTVSVWTCDFKNGEGSIHPGVPKTGKPNCTLTIEDDIAVEIFSGKLDAMKAFMGGKLKIGGNVLAAQKLQQLWAEEKPPSIESLMESNNVEQKDPSSSIKTFEEEIDSIPTSGLRCDLIFSIFKNRCHEEPDFLQRLRVIFQFNILKKGKPMCIWTADNKSKPEIIVYRSSPVNIKPDVISTVEDDDLLKIMTGKTPELPAVVEVMMKDPIKEGLKSESMIIDLMQRVVRLPDLPKQCPGLHQFDISKNGTVVSQWTLDFKTGRNTFYRGPANGDVVTQIEVDDIDFVKLVYIHIRLSDAINDGKVKIIKGDKNLVMKYDKLFTQPTSLKPKL